MSHLPQVRGSRLIRALQKAGFVLMRQTGGHAILRHQVDLSRKSGTLRAILRGAKITVEELVSLL